MNIRAIDRRNCIGWYAVSKSKGSLIQPNDWLSKFKTCEMPLHTELGAYSIRSLSLAKGKCLVVCILDNHVAPISRRQRSRKQKSHDSQNKSDSFVLKLRSEQTIGIRGESETACVTESKNTNVLHSAIDGNRRSVQTAAYVHLSPINFLSRSANFVLN